MNLAERIAATSERLTPTERRIAAVVLEDPTQLAFATVAELAAKVGTSRPSIVRFATKLGFAGYADLREHAQGSLSAKLSRPSQRIRQRQTPLGRAESDLVDSLRHLFESLRGPRLQGFARLLARGNNIWVLSGETSLAGARVLHSGLTMLRPQVHLIAELSGSRDLGGAACGDLAVVFDFPRYRRHAIAAARAMVDLGVDLLAITDGPLSPYAALTEHWFGLDTPAMGPFDSSVPRVAAAEILVAAVAHELRDQAQDRIDRTESLWAATHTFLDPS